MSVSFLFIDLLRVVCSKKVKSSLAKRLTAFFLFFFLGGGEGGVVVSCALPVRMVFCFPIFWSRCHASFHVFFSLYLNVSFFIRLCSFCFVKAKTNHRETRKKKRKKRCNCALTCRAFFFLNDLVVN